MHVKRWSLLPNSGFTSQPRPRGGCDALWSAAVPPSAGHRLGALGGVEPPIIHLRLRTLGPQGALQ